MYDGIVDPTTDAGFRRAVMKARICALVKRIVSLAAMFDAKTSAEAECCGTGGTTSTTKKRTNSVSSARNSSVTVIEDCGRTVCVLSDSDSEDECVFIETTNPISIHTSNNDNNSNVSNIQVPVDTVFPAALVARHLLENCVCVPTSKLSLRTAIALIASVCAMKYDKYNTYNRPNSNVRTDGSDKAVNIAATPEYCKTLSAGW